MAITSLTYEAPVRRSSTREGLDYELLEAAVELADQGRPLESLLKVFEHLLPGEKVPDLATSTFSFTQGSSKVTTRIENDDVVITVPLVKLPADGRSIAALRYVLTQISATGQLYQPRLSGDDIRLEFRDRLSRLHPAKIVEVLRGIQGSSSRRSTGSRSSCAACGRRRAARSPSCRSAAARSRSTR